MTQPVAKFRAGSISCALWENEASVNGRRVTMIKATVERRFKDPKTDSWRSSNSFGRNEIPLAIFCLARAFDKIIGEEQQDDTVSEEVVR